MLEQVLEIFRTVEQNDEFFDLLASVNKKTYDAHIKAGFTQDEAMKIVLAHGSIVKLNNNQ